MIKVKYVEVVISNGTRLRYDNCSISYLTGNDSFSILLVCTGEKNISFPLTNCLKFEYALDDEEVK